VKPLKFSKTVGHGILVTKRGDTFIRCGRRAKPAGVYNDGSVTTLLTDEGIRHIATPRGVVLRGPAMVKVV